MAYLDFDNTSMKASRNPISTSGFTDEYVKSVGAYGQMFLTFTTGFAAADKLEFSFVRNGETITFIMIADAADPDSTGNTLPAIGAETLAEWIEFTALTAFQVHPLLSEHFQIFLISGEIIFKAHEFGILTPAITSTNASGKFSTVLADGLANVLTSPHKVKVVVYASGAIGNGATNGQFRPIGTEYLSADSSGNIIGFDPHGYADALLRRNREDSGITFPALATIVTHDFAATCLIKMKVSEVFGDPFIDHAGYLSQELVVFDGGFNGKDAFLLHYFYETSVLITERKFLSWRPTDRDTSFFMPQLLSFMLLDELPGAEDLELEVITHYTKGADITTTSSTFTQRRKYVVTHFNAGYTELGIQAIDPFRSLVWYSVAVRSPSLGILAGPVTFYMEPKERLQRYVLFRNSTAGYEVERATGVILHQKESSSVSSYDAVNGYASGGHEMQDVYEISMGAKDLQTYNALQDIYFNTTITIQDETGRREVYDVIPASFDWREDDVYLHILTFKARLAKKSVGHSAYYHAL
jgi:hypothetical protein